MSSLRHLARRFAGSLSMQPPSDADDEWATSHLLPAEVALWYRMSAPDRRHAIAVARRFEAAEPDATRAWMAAALLHDCGKVESDLGTAGRVLATVWISLVGRHRAGWGDGRIASYARHEPLGAELLRQAGSDPTTVALVGRDPSAPPQVVYALAQADDL